MGNLYRLHTATSSFLLLCPRPCHFSCLFQLQRAHQSAGKQKRGVSCVVVIRSMIGRTCIASVMGWQLMRIWLQRICKVCKVCCKSSFRHTRQVSMLALLRATAKCAGLFRVSPVAMLRGLVSLLSSLAKLPASLCLLALLCTTTAVPLPCSIWLLAS